MRTDGLCLIVNFKIPFAWPKWFKLYIDFEIPKNQYWIIAHLMFGAVFSIFLFLGLSSCLCTQIKCAYTSTQQEVHRADQRKP